VHALELDRLSTPDARWRRLCELNVGDQVILSDMSAQDQNPRIRLE